jgi:hypothetical protein
VNDDFKPFQKIDSSLEYKRNYETKEDKKYGLKEMVLLSESLNGRLEIEIFMCFYFIFINGLKSNSSL